MGITEMPQFKVSVDNYRTVLLAESLRRRIGSTARVNPAEVQRIYEKIVREWKIRSVLFEKQEGAARMESEVRAGGSFDDPLLSVPGQGKGCRRCAAGGQPGGASAGAGVKLHEKRRRNHASHNTPRDLLPAGLCGRPEGGEGEQGREQLPGLGEQGAGHGALGHSPGLARGQRGGRPHS